MSAGEAWLSNVVHSKRHLRPSTNYGRFTSVIAFPYEKTSIWREHVGLPIRSYGFDLLDYGSARDLTALGCKSSQ
jgi:hypothetical protein